MIGVTLLICIIATANAFVLSGEPSQASSTWCQRYYVYTKERGCIKSCSHPDFAQCPDVFITIWKPKFCALNKEGNWQSFTFDCQACSASNPGFIGVADGKCEDTVKALPPLSKCGKNQIYTKERGCISSCSDPKWKQCGDFYPALYNPQYCALGKDGQWRSFTFSCQACTNKYPSTDYLGVSDGICEQAPQQPIDRCALMRCMAGTKCINGQCVANPADDTNSVSIPRKVYACPADSKYSAKTCTEPRPNDKTCPVIYYIRAPASLYCGVTADGTRVNFAQECSACKNKSIVYYFDKPCHKVPFVCEKQSDCIGEFCMDAKCSNPQECPYDWQTCFNGVCHDPCIYMKCMGCKFGRCAFQEANGKCNQWSSQSREVCENKNWACVESQCVDLCLRTKCPAYHRCNPKNGACEQTETQA